MDKVIKVKKRSKKSVFVLMLVVLLASNMSVYAATQTAAASYMKYYEEPNVEEPKVEEPAAEEAPDYTYDETTGAFATTVGTVTVPAATYTQDPVTGAYSVTPGIATLSVTGTI